VLGGAIAFSKRKTSAMDAPLAGIAAPAGASGASEPPLGPMVTTAGDGGVAGVLDGGRDEVLVAAIDRWIIDLGHEEHELRVRLLEVKSRLGSTR
jgi:hypothetical protein